ncbi:MAG: guanylate kinase [bacterium]|nr:guanylate kinase [bacterium]
MSNNGTLAVLLSSPSGGGKSTIIRHILKTFPEFWHSVSCTTRAPRYNEVNGREYHFVTVSEFERMVQADELAEFAEVHGDWYGTPLLPLRKAQGEGKKIIFDLDVDGAAKMKQRWQSILTIYIMPPSREELERRLRKRQSESEDVIQKRLKRYDREQQEANKYDYRIINDSLECAIEEVLMYIRVWSKVTDFTQEV